MIDDPTEPYEPPSMWTGEHVMHRMVEAYDVLRRLREQVGPRQVAAAWPHIVRDFGDEVMMLSNMEGESDEDRNHRMSSDVWEDWSKSERVTTAEVTAMNQAIAWPGRYLASTQDKVAINRWSRRRAQGREGGGEIAIALVREESKIIARGLRRDKIPVT